MVLGKLGDLRAIDSLARMCRRIPSRKCVKLRRNHCPACGYAETYDC